MFNILSDTFQYLWISENAQSETRSAQVPGTDFTILALVESGTGLSPSKETLCSRIGSNIAVVQASGTSSIYKYLHSNRKLSF